MSKLYSQAPLSVTIQTKNACHGSNDGYARAIVSGGMVPYTYVWSPSGANTATITGLGAGDINVLVTDGTGDTTRANSTLYQSSSLGLQGSSSSSCINSGSITVNSFGGTLPYTYSWSNGQTTSIVTGLNSGNYSVTVTDKNSCYMIWEGINVPSFNSGVSIYGGNITVCSGSLHEGIVALGGSSYLWSTGETTGRIFPQLTATTTYSVTISKDTCSKILSTTVYMNPSSFLAAGFSVVNPCLGAPTQFINTSISSDSITNTMWSFGDGTYSAVQHPTHTYSSPGKYGVVLFAKNQSGCMDSTIFNNYVLFIHPTPAASFTSNVGCVNAQTFFTDRSTISSGNIVNWNWDFGDQNIATIQNPAHVFSSPGNFNVSLIVTSDSGCKDTSLQSIMVKGPTVSVKMKQDIVNPLLWYAQATIMGDAPFSYLWNFGDGNTSTLQYPMHNYDTAGHYAICLTVTDANGCVSASCDSTYRLATPGIIGQLIAISHLTGITEEASLVFSVYPNPTNDLLNGSFSKTIKGTIRMIDMTGREILKQEINSNRLHMNVAGLPAGLYTLMVTSDEYAINHSKILITK